jgi:hypothetical protein
MPRRGNSFEWMEIGAAATELAWDAASVISLRMAKAALGGTGAHQEAVRMCSEKVVSLAELQASLLAGAFGTTPASAVRGTLRHYSSKVAVNRRRLSAP